METWMSWAMFLAIGAAAYWYYAHQNNDGVARGRSTTGKSTTNSLKEAVNWDSETKPKQKQPKAKAPRKSAKPAQDTSGKATAPKAAPVAQEEVAPPAASIAKAPSGKDVSDMLGERSVSPSVVSIKPSEKPAKSVKAQTQKAEVAQETKKQRQNRKKAEEAKAAREEEEKQRKALEEKQRRTAREARGEPAKNGQQSKPPASNPWTEVPSRGAVQPPKSAPTGQLLDTFEAPTPAPAATAPAPTNGKNTTSGPYNSLPSEEEQLRLAMEDSAWTTVPKGGKTKRKTVNEELAEERDDINTVKASQPAKPVRPTETLRESKNPSSRYQILAEEFNPKTGDEIDDWAVM
ncbi:hypothetical protein COCMIDRAFT_97851 [Bipolaris oryzae ATCC 44560]|uniref:Uncharacterized protein n=1 Tax=Bipolaris oryzae ATCC 44560 TaxID=930090 RepID=W6ZLY2_COCMI|nr:uncharacterized protein COCMIDRAFT_97851 [Bipolaris oryzae ATCC 44560]EUC44586.1 hypothetical protein COCMIDRAFT_97851 [Bipolaris oryzae ATCC 44560]